MEDVAVFCLPPPLILMNPPLARPHAGVPAVALAGAAAALLAAAVVATATAAATAACWVLVAVAA
eukprot:1157571-Pelagomonas_calceolata.AAC.2